MDYKKLLRDLILILALTSCFKTSEEIAREKQKDIEREQNQQIIADVSTQIKDLQERLNSMNGQIEEVGHNQLSTNEQKFASIESRLELINQQLEKNSIQIDNAISQLESQKVYIAKITSALKIIDKPSSASKPATDPKLDKALSYFNEKKYDKAKQLYLELLNGKSITAAQRNRILHNVGIIEFKHSKYSDAITYFSKVYTKWPRSSISPSCLYHIGLSFKSMGKKEEAKAIFSEFKGKYSSSNLISKVETELKNL